MLDVFLASPRAAVGLVDKTTNIGIVYVFSEEYVKKVTLMVESDDKTRVSSYTWKTGLQSF